MVLVETKVSLRFLCLMVAKRGFLGQILLRTGSLSIRYQCLHRMSLSSGLCMECGVEKTKFGGFWLELLLSRNSTCSWVSYVTLLMLLSTSFFG